MKTPEQMKERTLELLEQAKVNLKPSKEKISEEEMQIFRRLVFEKIFPFTEHPNRPKESKYKQYKQAKKTQCQQNKK